MQLVSPKSSTSSGVDVASPMTSGLVSPKPEASAKADPTAPPIVSSPVLSAASARRAATRRVVFTPSAEELAWRARAVQPLEQPAALGVEPLAQPRLTIDAIDITPLSVAPLTVGGASNK
jgi:hypothetical protein